MRHLLGLRPRCSGRALNRGKSSSRFPMFELELYECGSEFLIGPFNHTFRDLWALISNTKTNLR